MKIKFEIINLNKNNEIIMKGESEKLELVLKTMNSIVENSIKEYSELETCKLESIAGKEHVIVMVGGYKGIRQYKGYKAVVRYTED